MDHVFNGTFAAQRSDVHWVPEGMFAVLSQSTAFAWSSALVLDVAFHTEPVEHGGML